MKNRFFSRHCGGWVAPLPFVAALFAVVVLCVADSVTQEYTQVYKIESSSPEQVFFVQKVDMNYYDNCVEFKVGGSRITLSGSYTMSKLDYESAFRVIVNDGLSKQLTQAKEIVQ